MNATDLTGRVVAVTGGAGMLGSSFAGALLAAGARVAVLDLMPPSEERMAAILARAPDPSRLHLVSCDVSDDDSVQRAADDIEARLGEVDGLVNAAAIDAVPGARGANGPFETYPSDRFLAILDVNLVGAVRCCQVFGGRMASRGFGSIVNVASTYGIVGPDQRLYESLRRDGQEFYKPAVYSASKAALIGLTRHLAAYWGAAGVRVNALVPGGVEAGQPAAFIAAYAARTPVGRMARPDEYDGAVTLLLSDAMSYMTGSSLVVDGGFTTW